MTLEIAPSIERHISKTLLETRLCRPAGEEIFLTAIPLPDESASDVVARMMRRLASLGASGLSMTIFNGEPLKDANRFAFPVTHVLSEDSPSEKLCGVEVHAIRGAKVSKVVEQGRVVGTTWEDEDAQYCELGDLRDTHTSNSAEMQASHVFDLMESSLKSAGLSFANVYRTWFRNRRILSWYPEFNRVRTTFFKQRGVFERLIPASTGIGATNPQGAAVVAGLLAIAPKHDGVNARTVESPLQDSACNYGSSFSRAVEVTTPEHRFLTISGTASIDREGKTAHVNDTAKQVALTMEVITAILQSRKMDYRNVSRSLAYFRDINDYAHWDRWAKKLGGNFPCPIITNHTVCRDDLLFEIELDAVATTPV